MDTRTKHMPKWRVRAKCEKYGIPHIDRGGDTIFVGVAGNGYAIYNEFTGHFFGFTPSGIHFDSRYPRFQSYRWMKKLMKFFGKRWPK